MDELIEFLKARLDEDEWWAREASRGHFEGQYTPTGEHWQWTDNYGGPAIVDPALSDYVHSERSGLGVCLCSVEKYSEPRNEDTRLVISSEEIPTAVGGHIARHDPARVLREIEAKRRILAEHPATRSGNKWIDADTLVPDIRCATCHVVPEDADYDNCCSELEYPCPTLRALAAVYSDHPDFRDEWRP